jgi:hypothetical protein
MSGKNVPDVKRKSGADLRAQAEARLSARSGPSVEASRRADVIRAGLTNYAETMDKIAEAYRRQDWKVLGYESFNAYAGGEFGEARLKLTPGQRAQILPAFLAVGMSKRGAAAALGVDDKTIRNDLRGADNSAPRKKSPQVNESAAGGQTVAQPADGAEPEGGQTPVAAPASGPVPGCNGDGPDVTPTITPTMPAGVQSGDVLAGPAGVRVVGEDSLPEASEASPTGEAPAGSQDSDSPEAVAPVAGQPGIDHPDPHLGEARAGADLLAAGATPPPEDAGVRRGGDEVEGGDDPASDPTSTDPASEFMDGWRRLLRHALGVDRDVVGPMLTEDEFTEMYGDIEALTYLVKKLHGTP